MTRNNPALAVGCRYCRAEPGQPCINRKWKNQPLGHGLSHPIRVKDAAETQPDPEELPF